MKERKALIAWDGATVRSTAELDSPILTQLDRGCEVIIVETLALESGRERVRIDAPVDGWVSGKFLEAIEDEESDGEVSYGDSSSACASAPDAEGSGGEEDAGGSSVGSPRSRVRRGGSASKRRWPRGAPLSSKVLAEIASRDGNDSCYACGARLDALVGGDGEMGYGDVSTGTVVCGPCGVRARTLRSLDMDNWTAAQTAALLIGGNGQLRAYLAEHGATGPGVSAPFVYAYAETLAMRACAASNAAGVIPKDAASLDEAAHAHVRERVANG